MVKVARPKKSAASKPKPKRQAAKRPTIKHGAMGPAAIAADTMCMPGQFKPLRLPGPGTSIESTAVVAYQGNSSLTVGSSQYKVMLANVPAAPLWVPVQVQPHVVVFTENVGTIDASNGMTPPDAQGQPPQAIVRPSGATANSYSSYPFVKHDGKVWSLIPRDSSGAAVAFIQGVVWAVNESLTTFAAGSTGAIRLQFEMSDGVKSETKDFEAMTTQFPDNGYGFLTANINVYDYSYIRLVEMDCGTNLSNTFSFSTGSSRATVFSGIAYGTVTFSTAVTWKTTPFTAVWPDPNTVSMESATSVVPYRNTRLTAASALFSNTTKIINKEGIINAARVDTKARNAFTLSSTSGIPPTQRVMQVLEKGLYTYLNSGTEGTFLDAHYECGYGTFSDLRGNWTQYALFPLVDTEELGFVNVAFLNDPDGGTNLAYTVDQHLEFVCSSQLFSVGLSPMTLEDLRSAKIALQSAGVWFENPTHLAALAGLVMRSVRVAWPLLRPAARAAAMAGAEVLLGQAQKYIKNRRDTSQAGLNGVH